MSSDGHGGSSSESRRYANSSTPSKRLLLVGIMTSYKNLKTRARAIYDTWSRDVPGRLIFFIGNRKAYTGSLPVVILPDVKEKYPPQKKVFRMLQYFYEHFIEEFHFFLRSDDDMYAVNSRLTMFLSSLDSSVPRYIGQTGRGIVSERARLHLKLPYCKGGPGVILSNAALRALYPHINDCIASVSSHHEDTELGRCVETHLGLPCAKPERMKREFYERYHFALRKIPSKLVRTITVHAQKKPEDMYRLHHFMLLQRLQDLQQNIKIYSSEITNLKRRLSRGISQKV